MNTNLHITNITDFMCKHRIELYNEKFRIEVLDLRVVKGSWCYDANIALTYQLQHPKSYELVHKDGFIEYLFWYKNKIRLESLLYNK